MAKLTAKNDILSDLNHCQTKEVINKSDLELIEWESLKATTYKNKNKIYIWITRFIGFLLIMFTSLILYYVLTTMFPSIRMKAGITSKEITEIKEIIINVFSFMVGGIVSKVMFQYLK